VIKKIEETYSNVKRIEDLDINALFSEVLESQGDFYIHIQRNNTIAEQIKNRVLEQYLKEFEEIINDLTIQKKKGKKILNFKSEYLYMTSRQIDNFLKTQTENIKLEENELIIISRNIKRTLEPVQIKKNLSIFDLGTGDGSKADFILSNLQAFFPNLGFTYYAIDFSHQILDMAMDKVKMDHPFVNTIKINERIPEMENNNLLKKNMNSSANNLILCLGNLFSNLDYELFTQFFSRITRPSDLLVIGVEVRKNDDSDIKRIVDKYSSSADKHFVMSAFEEIDIREPNLKHEVVFNKETNKIEVYIEMLSLPQNLIKRVGDIGFKEGDKILMVSSWKPTAEEFREQLSKNFSVEIITNKDKTLAVAFCRIKSK
jgi:uncharacterized SAM-dependent methyltransferase